QGPTKIPPQNIPVSDRGIGSKGRGDPLLTPTGRPGENTGASNAGEQDRFKGGPFIPSDKSTPAALAAKPRNDGEELRIDSVGGSTLQPAGGFTSSGDSSAVPDDVAKELKKFGWEPGNGWFSRGDNGEVVFR